MRLEIQLHHNARITGSAWSRFSQSAAARLLFDEQRILGTEYRVNILLLLCCYKPGYWL